MDEAIAGLLAREAIRDQLANYGRGVDRRDWALLRAVWHEDGTLDYSFPGVSTPDQLIDVLNKLDDPEEVWIHPLVGVTFQIRGDKAATEAYASTRAYKRLSKTSFQETLVHARYLDRWSKRDGRWAIDHRVGLSDLSTVRTIEGKFRMLQGKADETDPSYQVLGGLA